MRSLLSADAVPVLTDRICTQPATTTPMAYLALASFLVVFGLNLLFGLALPLWVTGLLALTAGVLLLRERFRPRLVRK